MYYGATFICGGVFILPVVCFCLTEQEKMQGQLATQFMPFSANRVYFNVLQQSNVETCWRCETSLSFVTRNLESQTEYLALSQALSLKTLKVLKSPKLSKRRPTIFVGKGGRFRRNSQSLPPTQPPPDKRTQKDPSVQQSHQQGGNWWCLSDTFHFSHWNELSKLPS